MLGLQEKERGEILSVNLDAVSGSGGFGLTDCFLAVGMDRRPRLETVPGARKNEGKQMSESDRTGLSFWFVGSPQGSKETEKFWTLRVHMKTDGALKC